MCAITFLAMAEMVRLRCTRVEDLPVHSALPFIEHHLTCISQAGVTSIRQSAFGVMATIATLGIIVIRAVEIFMVSQSIVLALCFIVISAIPGEILQVAMYLFCRVGSWMNISEQEERNETALPGQTDLCEGRFASVKVQCISQEDDTLTSHIGHTSIHP
ncbi:hypothetical protein V8B97DRAFT_1944339 [Scleroderma yunnanense]